MEIDDKSRCGERAPETEIQLRNWKAVNRHATSVDRAKTVWHSPSRLIYILWRSIQKERDRAEQFSLILSSFDLVCYTCLLVNANKSEMESYILCCLHYCGRWHRSCPLPKIYQNWTRTSQHIDRPPLNAIFDLGCPVVTECFVFNGSRVHIEIGYPHHNIMVTSPLE